MVNPNFTAADFDNIDTAPVLPEANATAFHDVFQDFTRDQLLEVDASSVGGTTVVSINGSIPNTVQTWRNQPITGLPLMRNPEAVNYSLRGSATKVQALQVPTRRRGRRAPRTSVACNRGSTITSQDLSHLSCRSFA